MKKYASVILALVFLFSLTPTAFAADDPNELVPMDVYGVDFTYIVYATANLDISPSGLANCEASILCSSSVNHIQISSYLQQYNGSWVTLKHWTQDTYSNSASFDQSQSVASGYSYRHICYFYAYIGNSMVESASAVAYDSY